MRKFLPFFVVSLCGCEMVSYEPVSSVKVAPRARDCTFDVLTVSPEQHYVELGTIDLPLAEYAPRTVKGFKSKVHDTVCKAGGDAVIAQANGLGGYFRGTVIKFRQAPTQPD